MAFTGLLGRTRNVSPAPTPAAPAAPRTGERLGPAPAPIADAPAAPAAVPAADAPAVPLPRFVTAGFTPAQLAERACASCHKRWPRPRVAAAMTTEGHVLRICNGCRLVGEATTG
ncbi:hypothetical protein ACQEU3_36840 [Spirillospora sp. CA-253888]